MEDLFKELRKLELKHIELERQNKVLEDKNIFLLQCMSWMVEHHGESEMKIQSPFPWTLKDYAREMLGIKYESIETNH